MELPNLALRFVLSRFLEKNSRSFFLEKFLEKFRKIFGVLQKFNFELMTSEPYFRKLTSFLRRCHHFVHGSNFVHRCFLLLNHKMLKSKWLRHKTFGEKRLQYGST